MSSARRDRVLLVAFFVSGMAALGYELLWTRLLSTALGNETLGVLGVLAGFFGGLALGAAALHRRAVMSRNPVRMFALLELTAAAYAIVSPYLLHAIAAVAPAALAGSHASGSGLALSIVVAGASLLPGTFCLGATLPALVEARRRVIDDSDSRGVSRLYAANTAGATAGVLVTVYVAMPTLGIAWSAGFLALLGATAAGLAVRWARPFAAALAKPRDLAPEEEVDASGDPDPEIANEPWLLLVVLGATGLFGVGLEVVGVQVLSQVFENTVYTFADILAVYLVGTAAGAALYSVFVKQALRGRPAWVLAGMLIAVALATVASSGALALSPALLPGDDASYAAHLLAEIGIAALVFGLPTMVMGATFSHVMGLIAPSGVGRALAVNTLGSALAPIAFTLWAIPANGYRDALFVVVYGYLFTFGVFTWFRRFRAKWQVGLIIGVVVTTALAPRDLVLVDPDAEWYVFDEKQTVMGLVMVTEHEGDSPVPLRRLQVGKEFRMGGATAFGERRMGHIPLLLRPEATTALFLGVGTGATLGAVTHYPNLTRVDGVELVPAVVDMLEHFEAINAKVYDDPRVTVHKADARRFVAAARDRYDVIVADLFHPGRDGAGGLYTREHFEAVKEHLTDGGLFAQWLPLYQFDLPTLRIVVRTFNAVFPDARAVLGIYSTDTPGLALLGGGVTVDPEALRERLSAPLYADVVMTEPLDMLGAFLLDASGLAALAGDGPLNTDLEPRVLLDAPRVAYEGNRGRGWTNLEAILEHATPLRADALTDAGTWPDEIARFQTALTAYLVGEHARTQGDDPRAIGPDAVDHYLRAYEAAPDFPPARGMLYKAADLSADAARRIYPAMLQRTPKEPRVYQAYLTFLQRSGDRAKFAEIQQLAKENLPPR